MKAKVLISARNKRTARDGAAMKAYFTGITADNRIAQFQFQQDSMGEGMRYVEPDAFLVFAGFDTSSKGDSLFVTMYERTKV